MLDHNEVKQVREIFEEEFDKVATDFFKPAFDDIHERFATKDDLKAFATKDDLKAFATKDDLKAFATKDDLSGVLARYATKDDLKEAVTDLKTTLASRKDVLDLIDSNERVLRDLRIHEDERHAQSFNLRHAEDQITNHEKRIIKLEKRVSPVAA